MSEEKDLTEAQIKLHFTRRLTDLEALAGTLQVITDHGELCRDGQRAVNGIVDLTEELIRRIEQDTDVKGIADNIQTAVSTL